MNHLRTRRLAIAALVALILLEKTDRFVAG